MAEVHIIDNRQIGIIYRLQKNLFIRIVVCFILGFSYQNAANDVEYTFLFQNGDFFFIPLRDGLFFTGFYEKNLFPPFRYIRK